MFTKLSYAIEPKPESGKVETAENKYDTKQTTAEIDIHNRVYESQCPE